MTSARRTRGIRFLTPVSTPVALGRQLGVPLLTLIASVVLMVPASVVSASIIDNGTFTTDTDSGLDWLDLTLTAGQSYDAVMAGAYVAAGWRYATQDEVQGVFLAFGGTDFVQSLDNFVPAVTFISLFGSTENFPEGQASYGITAETTHVGQHWTALVSYFDDLPFAKYGRFVSRFDELSDTGSVAAAGSYLVRESDTSSTVPEPTSIVLLVSGVAVLGWVRRCRRR